MPHQHHFLSRLDRLSLPHVELSLSLYRDDVLVRFVLGQIRIPERAERVALSLDDPVLGPFLVVTRDGVFVTCLGKGMSTGDLPIVPRGQLDGILAKAGELRARREVFNRLAGETGGVSGLLTRMFNAGGDLSREEYVAVSSLQPLYGTELLRLLYGAMNDLDDTRDLIVPHLRRAHKLRGAPEELLRSYWKVVWTVGHLSVLVAMDGTTLIDIQPDDFQEEFYGASFSWGSVRQGLISLALRGVWAAARIGKPLLPVYKRHLLEANTPLTILDATMGTAAIGLRHARVRAEVDKALAVVAKKWDEPSPEARLLGAVSGLALALMKVHDDEPQKLLGHHQALGARLAFSLTRRLPKGSPYAFEREEDVPQDLALTLAANSDSDYLTHAKAHYPLFVMVPWVARASAEALYLPRDFIRATRIPWRPEDSYTLLRGFAEIYRPRRTVRQGPTRNGPCPCGSDKKYKRCCGASADA